MQGVAVLLIPFAVMVFALSMERLQTYLDGSVASDTAAMDAADASSAGATIHEATMTTPDATSDTPGPAPTSRLRFAS